MEAANIIGFVGGAIMTLGLIPQVLRVYKLRSAREISLLFTLLLLFGLACWVTYGILLRLFPVVFWNALALLLMASLLLAKLKYGR